MSDIIFKPWIGKKYGTSKLGRMLILGDSHYYVYPVGDYSEFTRDIIGADISLNAKFFKNVARVLGHTDFKELRDNVAFANAIQEILPTATHQPSPAQIKATEKPIQEYLRLTQPERMIVFSSRIWQGLFNTPKSWGKYVQTITVGSRNATVWELNYEDKRCYALGVYHPSYQGWKVDDWKPIIDTFLSKY